jgi:hypothetical protein
MNSVNESRQEVQAVRPMKMSGIGLAQVNEQIRVEFERARRNDVAKPMRFKQELEPLAETAAPILRAAQNRLRNTTVRRARDQDNHFVVVPKESVAELFALCERAVSELKIPPPREERHEVGE